jgi:predicted acylesterase/phospholipase RssA
VPFIDLLSVGEDSSPLLEAAAVQLNCVQDQFEFRVVKTSSSLGAQALAYQRDTIVSTELFDWLTEQRRIVGGLNNYHICFVSRPLRSTQLGNLFGSHRAEQGMAVVTLHLAEQYVRAQVRYCCYFLVRYTLSFINPTIKSHTEPERKWCYFGKKIHKPEVLDSLQSGRLCDQCNEALQAPYGPNGRKPSVDELAAMKTLREEVAGVHPRALVMKGGGVKGLAFAGALLELERHYWFDQHVGASAGAIAAILLAANYTPTELLAVLRATRFLEFKDASWWQIPFNLLFRQGMYPGENFRLWMAALLQRKFNKLTEVTMADLRGAVIYACRRGSSTLVFDSAGNLRGTPAAYAARCSMAIPFVFAPETFGGRRVFDGGVRNNFPLKTFLDSYPNKPFVGLYLGWPDNSNRTSLFRDLYEIVLDGEEREVVQQHRDSIVVIDPRPISTVDFDLSRLEQDFLIAEGRACALEYLSARKFQNGPRPEQIAKARREADCLRAAVVRLRQWRNLTKLLALAAAATAFCYWLY